MDTRDWYSELLVRLGEQRAAREKVALLRDFRASTATQATMIAGLIHRTRAVSLRDVKKKAAAYRRAAATFKAVNDPVARTLATEAEAFALAVEASCEPRPVARGRLWSVTATRFTRTAAAAAKYRIGETERLCTGWRHLARALSAQARYESGVAQALGRLKAAAQAAVRVFDGTGGHKLLGLSRSLLHYVSAMETRAAFERSGNVAELHRIVRHMRAAAREIKADEFAVIRASYAAYADLIEHADA